MTLPITGERWIPGKTAQRVEEDHQERYKFAMPYVQNKRVLDIACGTGMGSYMLASAGTQHIDGADIAPEAINYATEHFTAPNISFTISDIIAYKTRRLYDVIVCFETIEHIPDYNAALANLRRLLRPGGTLLISSPNRPVTSPNAQQQSDKPLNTFHVREFTPAELTEALQQQNFRIDKNALYGQRQHKHFRNPYLRTLYNKLYQPQQATSAAVTPVTRLTPRYFVIVARAV